MLYAPSDHIGQLSASIEFITGRNLAHAPRSKTERAFIAADLHRGKVQLERLTILQCALLAKVCPPYIQLALKVDPDQRRRIERGELPLAAAVSPLAAAWFGASPAQRADFVSAVGAEAVWSTIEAVI
jgi:hypothetical protein